MSTSSSTLPDNWKSLPGFAFGDSPEMADELLSLVLVGTKTATCSARVEFEIDGEPLPNEGERWIVLDGEGTPTCIIEISSVEVMPFDAVGEDFAAAEGEGDLSHEYWSDAHRGYFERQVYGWTEDMLLVCERFKVIHVFTDQDLKS